MAAYNELYSLLSNTALKNRIRVACVIAAETIRTEDVGTANHANRLIWAAAVFANPEAESGRMFMSVIAANKDNTVAQIEGASDAQIQAAVDAAVDLFATG